MLFSSPNCVRFHLRTITRQRNSQQWTVTMDTGITSVLIWLLILLFSWHRFWRKREKKNMHRNLCKVIDDEECLINLMHISFRLQSSKSICAYDLLWIVFSSLEGCHSSLVWLWCGRSSFNSHSVTVRMRLWLFVCADTCSWALTGDQARLQSVFPQPPRVAMRQPEAPHNSEPDKQHRWMDALVKTLKHYFNDVCTG